VVESLTLEALKKNVDVLQDMVYWGNTGGRQMVGLNDLGGLFHPWCSYEVLQAHQSPRASVPFGVRRQKMMNKRRKGFLVCF